MGIEENKAVVTRFVEELWNDGNLDEASDIISADARNPRRTPMWTNGPESVAAGVAALREQMDVHREVHDVVAEGDKVVVYSTFHVTLKTTGEEGQRTGVACFVVEGGKIVEEPWSQWDPPPFPDV